MTFWPKKRTVKLRDLRLLPRIGYTIGTCEADPHCYNATRYQDQTYCTDKKIQDERLLRNGSYGRPTDMVTKVQDTHKGSPEMITL
jgi:hypothetical protein